MKRYIKSTDIPVTYYIRHGRGEAAQFDSLDAAKAWQVRNIFDYYTDNDYEDEVPDRYDWIIDEVNGIWEFVMYQGEEMVDVDTSDGSGWFIESDID